jgi:hypothetical protein
MTTELAFALAAVVGVLYLIYESGRWLDKNGF